MSDPARASVFAEHEKQDWSLKGVIHRTVYRPFQMLFMEPILVLLTIYLSLVYGLLYLREYILGLDHNLSLTSRSIVFQAFPIIYISRRGLSITEDGLLFIGVGIGTTLGAVINYLFTWHYPALIVKWRGFPPAEERLYGAMLGAPGLVIGAFWLGWTGEYTSIPWYVPALATVLIGTSISLIFMSILVRSVEKSIDLPFSSYFYLQSYLVDTYLYVPPTYIYYHETDSVVDSMYSASAFAGNTMIRSAVASTFPLFTVQLFTKVSSLILISCPV